MKERLLTGWNFTRILYLVMGIVIVIQGMVAHQWMGLLLGAYFASMGLFAFGCAAGNCFGSRNPQGMQQTNLPLNDITYEEIKSK